MTKKLHKLPQYTKARNGEPTKCMRSGCNKPVRKGDVAYCYEHRIRRHKRPNGY